VADVVGNILKFLLYLIIL